MTDDLTRRLDRVRWPLRLAYLAILLLATLTDLGPVQLPGGRDAAEAILRIDITGTRALVDVVRNVVLFAGWGLVWMATARPGAGRRALALATGTGLAISVGVETAQGFSAVRDASPLDVVANGFGALAGAVCLVVLVRRLAARREARSFVGVPAALFAAGYGIATLGEALIPLLRQDRLAVWGAPWSRFAYALRSFDPASFGTLPWSEVVLFAPAGFFLAAALREAGHGYRRSAAVAAGAGSLLVVGAELARGTASLAIAGGPIVVHVAAVVLGAWLAAVVLPRVARNLRGAERPQLLYALYALLLSAWFLRPYVPALRPSVWVSELTGRWWMPMAFAADRMDLFSVVDVTNSFFLYLPLGGLLATWPVRRRGAWSGVLPAVVLGALLEAAQLFVSGRTLALADALIAGAGAWTGWVAVRRAGYPVRGSVAGSVGQPDAARRART